MMSMVGQKSLRIYFEKKKEGEYFEFVLYSREFRFLMQ